MALFNLFKKKEEKPCCCGAAPKKEQAPCCCAAPAADIRSIQVLGAGCKSCHQQYTYAKEAVGNLGLNIEVEYITDMEKIMEYGVMSMPAIVVNGQVVAYGKVLKAAEVEKLLK